MQRILCHGWQRPKIRFSFEDRGASLGAPSWLERQERHMGDARPRPSGGRLL